MKLKNLIILRPYTIDHFALLYNRPWQQPRFKNNKRKQKTYVQTKKHMIFDKKVWSILLVLKCIATISLYYILIKYNFCKKKEKLIKYNLYMNIRLGPNGKLIPLMWEFLLPPPYIIKSPPKSSFFLFSCQFYPLWILKSLSTSSYIPFQEKHIMNRLLL
jgi:hypothetical protein